MMVMHNAETDSCWPISTNPDAKYNNPDHDDCNLKLRLWQLVRASTAAPSFFPLEEVHLGKRVFRFQDGGLTAHNNHALKLFQMATDPAYRLRRHPDSDQFGWETGEDRLLLVSVGTGKAMDARKGLPLDGLGLPSLARYAPKALMRGIAIENDVTCRIIAKRRLLGRASGARHPHPARQSGRDAGRRRRPGSVVPRAARSAG